MTQPLFLFQANPADETAITAYIPILLFLIIAIGIPVVALGVARFLRRRVFHREKLMPYECGIDPIRDAKDRISIRYYVIAMLFLVFDVETIFLFPWAVIYDQLAVFGLIEMLVFIGILVVGYYWAWRKGALEWV
ncbi:MAG TPA: NADH-quinone oxidoreductase subunit A [Blastocatellia bacterium]|nr:NADH-quinone oxidoreductase subunit A [Blastocatellia bacterium]